MWAKFKCICKCQLKINFASWLFFANLKKKKKFLNLFLIFFTGNRIGRLISFWKLQVGATPSKTKVWETEFFWQKLTRKRKNFAGFEVFQLELEQAVARSLEAEPRLRLETNMSDIWDLFFQAQFDELKLNSSTTQI